MAIGSVIVEILGDFYSGQQSQQQTAILQVDAHGYASIYSMDATSPAAVEQRQKLFSGYFSSIEVSSRLGNTPRYLNFYEGQKFETRDNDQIDQLLQRFSPNKRASFIHLLESRWRYVFAATVLVVAAVAWMGVYGIPLSAKAIVGVLPDSFAQKAGKETLTLLDKDFLQPSELDDATKERVRQHFAQIMREHQEYRLTLLFRDSEVGANAFALPNGTIVFTDDMITLAENDDELLSVMAHEVGHVVHQHGMRGVVQGSLLGFALAMMTGDAAGATEYFASIPGFLTQLGYSRAFEREADDYALAYMHEKNIDLAHFSRLMSRVQFSYLAKRRGCSDTEASGDQVAGDDALEDKTSDSVTIDEDVDCSDDHADDGWQKYLSTHPSLQERLEKFDSDNTPNG